MMKTAGAENTRSRLVRAAAGIFAERGFNGTTVAAVSEAAEANIAAVNYHFGDKQSLYQEALRWSFELAKEKYPIAPEPMSEDPDQQLKQHIQALVRQIFASDSGGYYIRMFAKEIAEPSFAIEMIFSELMVRNRDNLRAAVKGVLGDGMSPEQLQLGLLSVVAQFQFYNFNRTVRELVGHRRPKLPQPDRIAEHIYEFSIAGLKAMKAKQRLEKKA